VESEISTPVVPPPVVDGSTGGFTFDTKSQLYDIALTKSKIDMFEIIFFILITY